MAAVANPAITEREYLALAETSEEKVEFVDGEIRMMAGGSLEHGSIIYRTGLALGPLANARGCRGFNSNVRIRIEESGQYVYPDLSFVCQKAEQEGTSLLNPTLIVKVLSPGTAAYDRGRKLELYLSIPSVQEVLLVGSEEPRVERYQRHGDVWLYETVRGLEGMIGVLDGTLRLVDLYQDVEFENS